MKAQVIYKIALLLVCSCFVASTYAQDDPPTLPDDPEGVTDYLPLKLVSFSASMQGSSAQLSWKTTNEVNVNNFVIEKGTDGKNFQEIATVAADNNLVNDYAFTDNSLVDNATYYRLRMVDKDGSYQYSFIILLKSKTSNSLSMYPNPATSLVTIVHGLPQGKASLIITNVTGIKLQVIAVNANVQQTSFALSNNLKPGNYLLQYSDEGGSKTLFFTKQ